MGLLGDWLGAKRMDDPVRGTAQVVGASGAPDQATSASCNLTLVVNADGVLPTPVKHTCIAPASKWPRPGSTLPITVDRANPDRLKVEWDEMQTGADSAWQAAQAMAGQAPSGGTPTVPGFPGMTSSSVVINASDGVDPGERAQMAAFGVDIDAANSVVINASDGVDPGERAQMAAFGFDIDAANSVVINASDGVDPGERAQMAAFGFDIDALVAQARQMQSMFPGVPGGPPAPPAGDDLTAKLQQLAALRDSGALTDDEFAAAKAKLLG